MTDIATRRSASSPPPPLDRRALARLRRAAEAGLAERQQASTGAPLDRAQRVAELEHAFVSSIPADARAASIEDIRAGDGGELRQPRDPTLHPRFHSSRSSCALAVNCFGPWRCAPETLTVGGLSGFTSLWFERKLPIAGVPRRPPNLDLVAEGPVVLAVESKLLEHLSPSKPATFADAYDGAVETLAHPTWRDAYRRLRRSPDRFALFNSAQIVKHYLGLKSAYRDQPARLLYLFWEPTDAARLPPLVAHRAEVGEFAGWVDDPEVGFTWSTYPELWSEWAHSDGAVHAGHLHQLRNRYELTLRREG